MLNLSAQNFWQFSLALYQHNNVQSLLLNLQDEVGLNVNLALFCAFLNKQNLYLNQHQIEQLHSAVQQFNHSFTSPLRQLRSSFKLQSNQLNNYDSLRQHLLNAELILEQQEQQVLIDSANQIQQISPTHANNLQLYQQLISTQSKAKSNSLHKLSDLNQYIH